MSGYPLLDVFWTMFMFFCWLLWILLVILLPLIGVVACEIVHSDHLSGVRGWHSPDARAQDEAYRADGTSDAFELSKLSDLHDRGVLSDAEFERGKERVLR